MATRVSRGFALIRISLFIGARHARSSRRLIGARLTDQVVYGAPRQRCVDRGITRMGCPSQWCDRPRRVRLSSNRQQRGPRGAEGIQLITERRAIGPWKQAAHHEQDERAKHGHGGTGQERTQIANVPLRVAERESGGRIRKGSHSPEIKLGTGCFAMSYS